MPPKMIYLALCVLGAALPLSQLIPFLRDHGLDLQLLVAQLFANPISSFFGLDVIVTTVVLWVFVVVEGGRTGVRHGWAPIAASLLVGVSLALPLFLYLCERRLDTAGD